MIPEAIVTGLPVGIDDDEIPGPAARGLGPVRQTLDRSGSTPSLPGLRTHPLDQGAPSRSVRLDDDDVAAAGEGKEAVGRGPEGWQALAVCR